jgi:hypothetical protein
MHDTLLKQQVTTTASGGTTLTNVTIPELYTDPIAPTAGSAWVLATDIGAIGTPIGLLLSLTHAVSTFSYQFSYRTNEGTTIRTGLI